MPRKEANISSNVSFSAIIAIIVVVFCTYVTFVGHRHTPTTSSGTILCWRLNLLSILQIKPKLSSKRTKRRALVLRLALAKSSPLDGKILVERDRNPLFPIL